jgi:hypothetical protein
MLCIALFGALIVLLRRRNQGTTVAMPLLIVGLGAVRTLLLFVTLIGLVGTFKSLANVPANEKQQRLEAGIADSMRFSNFGAVFDIPVIVAAWLIDGVLRRRQREKLPLSQPAPANARCATHADAAATLICSRCGAFMCASCGAADGSRCATCFARA